MRPIDADALKEQYYERMKELLKATETVEIAENAISLLCGSSLIIDAPTIEAEPVRHEWISVKDRLPETYIDVLAWVTDPDHDPAFNDYIAVAWVKDYDGGWDSDSFIEDAYGTVTYWMPLPEPPKEEEYGQGEGY